MTDTDIRPLMRQIQGLQQTLSAQIDGVTSEVGHVRNDLRLTSDDLRQLRADFNNYVNAAARAANVQLSTTEVGNLKAQLDRDFGHYAAVRRTSIGTLQAFDVGVVSNETVTSVSEELMIQTPRYWLAPALVALAAWSRDASDTAEKAVQEAYSRDSNKTSLFFSLVLRRQGRLDASVRWLRHYLDSLSPTALTREFAVVLEAASYDAFGPAGQQLVGEKMEAWVAHLRSDPAVVEQQIRRWVGEFGVMRRQLDVGQYPTLAKLAPAFPELQRQIESASALPETTEKYLMIKDFAAPIPAFLEDLLDDILDTLVTEYDEEELPLRRDVLFHESVIEERGDTDRARARSDELQHALEESSDVVSLQTEAAINPENLGVSTRTQRVAIGVSIDEFRSAAHRFMTEYRGRAIEHVEYAFDASHSNYATKFKFVGANIHSSVEELQGVAVLQNAWRETMDSYIAAAQFKPMKYVTWAVVALVISILIMTGNVGAGVAVLIVAGGVVGWMTWKAKTAADQAVQQAEEQRDKATEDSVKLYREAGAQLVDARQAYQDLDAQEDGLLQLIDSWPTARLKEAIA